MYYYPSFFFLVVVELPVGKSCFQFLFHVFKRKWLTATIQFIHLFL